MKHERVGAAIMIIHILLVVATYALQKKFLTLKKVELIGCVVNCAALIRTVIIEVLSMVAIAYAIGVMLEATVSIATEIRALVMELYLPTPKIIPCAPVNRVGGVIVVIVRKAMRARMDQMTNRANMEDLVETFQTVSVIVQGQITKENIAIKPSCARLDQMANRAKMEDYLQGI